MANETLDTFETVTPGKPDGPVFKCKIGAFETAIFLQEVDGRTRPSIALEKSFTSDGSTWKHQKMHLLNASEADKLICVLQETKKALYTQDFQQ